MNKHLAIKRILSTVFCAAMLCTSCTMGVMPYRTDSALSDFFRNVNNQKNTGGFYDTGTTGGGAVSAKDLADSTANSGVSAEGKTTQETENGTGGRNAYFADAPANVGTDPNSTTAGGNTYLNNTYYESDVWQAVPMVSKETVAKGIAGGEGCQWTISVTFDSIDGSLAFIGTDVGGLYRSTDGGVNWEPATVGFRANGATGIAIDPNNKNRVLAVGCNSYAADNANGVHLSTDAGQTWNLVLPARVGGYRDFRQQFAFDKSSYDPAIGGSKIVYWSREATAFGADNAELHPALYKSTDGGRTWTEINAGETYWNSEIAVHPTKGYVYAANSKGFYKSTNGGASFTQKFPGNVTSMDMIYTRENSVYIVVGGILYVSNDSGETFTKVASTGFGGTAVFLKVSPANPNRMVIQEDYMDGKNGGYPDLSCQYYSTNGGKNWARVDKSNNTNYRWVDNSWIPYCVRQTPSAWHPTDENVVLTLGGDFVMRSTNGGQKFVWSNSGYNGMMTGGMFSINVNHPNWMFNPSQDYNGGYSLDGGKTWKYVQWYDTWGGFTYGGYTLNPKTMVTGFDDKMGDYKYKIATTFDGGKTINRTNNVISGYQVANGVLGDENVVFMGEWRSADAARTWSKMSGCMGVFAYNPLNGTLYGVDNSSGYNIVSSKDEGLSWQVITTVGSFRDMAYDQVNGYIYVIGNNATLYRIDENTKIKTIIPTLPTDYQGGLNARTIAVDPADTNIIYIGSAANIYMTDFAVIRSEDGGQTWTNLTRTVGDGRKGPDGGREATCVRVNLCTRELFVGTCCRGMWKITPPKKTT